MTLTREDKQRCKFDRYYSIDRVLDLGLIFYRLDIVEYEEKEPMRFKLVKYWLDRIRHES
jgi:hypothetical protein